MLYFIAWVVLMLAAILAVPIVSMMEKRKLEGPRKKKTKDDEEAAASDDGEPLEPLEEAEGEVAEEGAIQESDANPEDPLGTPVPDDFSAFDEEFK
jgi:flagellar biosynthesis/type III secretory pathway M-ring protein FliF/YscJ